MRNFLGSSGAGVGVRCVIQVAQRYILFPTVKLCNKEKAVNATN